MIKIDDDALRAWCRSAVQQYRDTFPDDAPKLAEIEALLAGRTLLADRTSLPGHVTASALLYDRSARRLLLIHHRGLDRWLQPGGHVDPGELPPAAAMRECLEEVGFDPGDPLAWAADRAMPIYIDSHRIPANPRKGEPAHTHHDFRFVFGVEPSSQALTLQTGEVADADWMGADDPRFPADLRPVITRLGDLVS